MTNDEENLLRVVRRTGKTPRDVGASLGIPPKRVIYFCEKWARLKFYNYGVAPDLGWFEGPDPRTP